MLTTDELIEHIRTALGGVGPQQVKRVLKAVGVLAHRERAALARAEAAEAEAAEARATNEALAELAASETERRVALAERVAELEAQLEEATQLLSIAIDRLPEEEQEIVALRWALSGTFTNELPTIAAPAPQEPTP
jgi:DNA-directed RNA polymerase specialized sigma subunit